MLEVVEENDEYVNNLKLDQAKEIVLYYDKLLELYSDFELYEECEDIVMISDKVRDFIEKSEEIVGNMN